MIKSETTNSFQGGLDMDKHPIILDNSTYTYALNATLTTGNGNEGLMQNDMGNTLVGTVKLPEGYTPIGTCEFGGIVYIVSHNPITKRSQVGCFPSPLRLHFNDAVAYKDKGFTDSDFVSDLSDTDKLTYHLPNAEDSKLVNLNKLIELSDDKLFPGDKYFIYATNTSDYENVKDLGTSDLISLSLVAISESGDIIPLDNIKLYNWKEIENGPDKNYYIYPKSVKATAENLQNLDESLFSIFSSKKAGKLGILALLTLPENYSISWKIIETVDPDKTSTKKLLWSYTYNSQITGYSINGELKNTSKDKIIEGEENGEGIKEYYVTPKLQYGYWLEQHLKFIIDWDKLNTGTFDITHYKYYIHENNIEIRFNFELYPYLELPITGIDVEFYGIPQNINKPLLIGTYKIRDKVSYSGLHVITIPIDNNGSIPEFEASKNPFCGNIIETPELFGRYVVDGTPVIYDENYYIDSGKKSSEYKTTIPITVDDGDSIYENISGQLFSNRIYGIKIKIITEHDGQLVIYGNSEKYNRFLWTIPNLNQYYYQDNLDLPANERSDFQYYTNDIGYTVQFVGDSNKDKDDSWIISPDLKYTFDNEDFSGTGFSYSMKTPTCEIEAPEEFTITDLDDNILTSIQQTPLYSGSGELIDDTIKIKSTLDVGEIGKTQSDNDVRVSILKHLTLEYSPDTRFVFWWATDDDNDGDRVVDTRTVLCDLNTDTSRNVIAEHYTATDQDHYLRSLGRIKGCAFTSVIARYNPDWQSYNNWRGTIYLYGYETSKYCVSTYYVGVTPNDWKRLDLSVWTYNPNYHAWNTNMMRSYSSIKNLGYVSLTSYNPKWERYYLLGWEDSSGNMRIINVKVPSSSIASVSNRLKSMISNVCVYSKDSQMRRKIFYDYSDFTVNYEYTLYFNIKAALNISYLGLNLESIQNTFDAGSDKYPKLLYTVLDSHVQFKLVDKKSHIKRDLKLFETWEENGSIFTLKTVKPNTMYLLHNDELTEIQDGDPLYYTYNSSDFIEHNFGRMFTLKNGSIVLRNHNTEGQSLLNILYGRTNDDCIGGYYGILQDDTLFEPSYQLEPTVS